MGEVVTFRLARRPGSDDRQMDFAGLLQARNPTPAEVVQGPVPVHFRRWVRCLDPERAAWSCLRFLANGEQAEAVRWWKRHRAEAFTIGSKTLKCAALESLWLAYTRAVRVRMDQLKSEYRTRAQWELALAASKALATIAAKSERDLGRDGVA